MNEECRHPSKWVNRWTENGGTKIVKKNGQDTIVNICIDHVQESCSCGWQGSDQTSTREC